VNRGDIPIELGDSWLTKKTMEVVVLITMMTKWSTVSIGVYGIFIFVQSITQVIIVRIPTYIETPNPM
jgi:hypothetical protein